MERQSAPHQIIRDLAASSYGVVHRAELLGAGLSATIIDRNIKCGILLRLHPGVYAVGHRHLRLEGEWLAAVRAVGMGALLSHEHAAALWGLQPEPVPPPVHVTLVGRAGRIRHAGIVIHRPRRLDEADVAVHRGIPVTALARTILDLSVELRGRALELVIRAASRQRLFDLRAVEDVLVRYPHHRGRRPLAHVLGVIDGRGTEDLRSVLEVWFLQLCDDHGFPKPVVNGHVGQDRVDFHWPDARLVVELDGFAWHATPTTFAEDRRRDQRLTLLGYRVVRFTYDDLRSGRNRVVSTVASLLARGGGAP